MWGRWNWDMVCSKEGGKSNVGKMQLVPPKLSNSMTIKQQQHVKYSNEIRVFLFSLIDRATFI
jgi:hypothetical protein